LPDKNRINDLAAQRLAGTFCHKLILP
jgi:hypothetical protein